MNATGNGDEWWFLGSFRRAGRVSESPADVLEFVRQYGGTIRLATREEMEADGWRTYEMERCDGGGVR